MTVTSMPESGTFEHGEATLELELVEIWVQKYQNGPDLHKSHLHPLSHKRRGTFQPPGGALPQDAHLAHHKGCNYQRS